MNLSVNLNKVALLRNSRRTGVPDVLEFAGIVHDAGADGITVHPRPDERHIRRSDLRVVLLASGAAALLHESAWFRLLTPLLGAGALPAAAVAAGSERTAIEAVVGVVGVGVVALLDAGLDVAVAAGGE